VFDHPVTGAIGAEVIYAARGAAVAPILLNVPSTALWELLCAAAGPPALPFHIPVVVRFGEAINSDCHWARRSPTALATPSSPLAFGPALRLHPEFARIGRRWDLGRRLISVLCALCLAEVVADRQRAPKVPLPSSGH
jgi:hypothetical protein